MIPIPLVVFLGLYPMIAIGCSLCLKELCPLGRGHHPLG